VFSRFRGLGVTDVFVDTGDDEAANDFYESTGFTEAYHGHTWRKTWRP
jgi:hypothetical protein